MTIELASGDLGLKLDPAHGAEIIDLTDLRSGVQLLGHPPFAPREPLGGDLDEETWTARYRGGWQLLAPNAGNECMVDGVRHGFHGRASVDPWRLVVCEQARAVLRWSGHGLELTRVVELAGDTVTVGLSWTASSAPAPLIAVEHIVIGRALLSGGCEIRADAAAHELSESEGPLKPAGDLPRWPRVLTFAGEVNESGVRRGLEPERVAFSALTDWTTGTAALANDGLGVRLDLSWDRAKLGAAWLWEEIRSSGGIWGNSTELLGFEPASVPHSLGLARAIEAGQALWAKPGERDGYQLTMRVRQDV